jgi:capsular exopolysaccharide synthesis family protein
VVLVDADLRRPSIAKYMGFEGRVGLTTVLIGKATVGDVVQPWQDTSLDVLASGRVPPNPSELLGSGAMSRLLADLTASYDVVVIDSPPLLPVTDAAILSKLVGGAIVVAGADSTHKAQLRTALESLAKVDADVLGLVLNKVERKSHDNHYGDYYGTVDPALTGTRSGRRSARQGANAPARAAEEPAGPKRSSWPGEQMSANRR